MSQTRERYTAVAIVLHWAIAAAILFLLPLGFWMHEQAEHGDASLEVFRAFQLHKSIGLTVLALSAIRLTWRLINPPPPLPAHMPAWERFAARATHWAFYALMFGLPLSGWLFVSAGWSLHEDRTFAVPTHWFGMFEVPALFGLTQAEPELREAVAEAAFGAHKAMAFGAIGLALLHVLAALKHHVFDRDSTLAQMLPGLRAPFEDAPPPRNPVRLAILGGGLALIAVALAAAVLTVTSPRTEPAPQQTSNIEIAPAIVAPAPTPETPAEAAAPLGASDWRVDAAASSISFAYVYGDETGETRFSGRFTRWRADILFAPDLLDASHANITIDAASAAPDFAAHTPTLQGVGWFDTARFPTASFRTTEIRQRGNGYEARGDLTLRDRTREVRLPFTLTIQDGRAIMDGRISIDRRAFGVGEDAEGDDLIGRDVEVIVHVEATRAP